MPASPSAPTGADRRIVRVGGIDYLNSLPLLWSLDGEGDPPLEVELHVPGRLADLLACGTLDVALVPVVAYAERDDYWVIPGVSIASHGPVRSIRLYHRRPLEELHSVGLDTSSRTSALLTRLLCRDLWGSDPRFERAAPGDLRREVEAPAGSSPHDAALLIGDAALACRTPGPGWSAADLGRVWTAWTGLPFVYAFWAVRAPHGPDELPSGLVERFLRARDLGRARIDDIVRAAPRPPDLDEAACRHYLAQVIRHDLRPDARRGLAEFFERLHAAGLLDAPAPPLRLLPDPVAARAQAPSQVPGPSSGDGSSGSGSGPKPLRR